MFSGDESRRGRGCDADVQWRRVAATPWLRRGYSAETSRGDTAAATDLVETGARLRYNAKIKEHGLESMRVINEVDAAGRLVEKGARRGARLGSSPTVHEKSKYYGPPRREHRLRGGSRRRRGARRGYSEGDRTRGAHGVSAAASTRPLVGVYGNPSKTKWQARYFAARVFRRRVAATPRLPRRG